MRPAPRTRSARPPIPFAACYLASRLILFGLYLRAWRALPDARPTINVYLTVIGLSSVVWAISIATPGDIRYLLWGVAVAIDAVGPALATLRRDKLPLHVEHLPERFALLVILVLGEAVGGGVRGVHEAHWAGPSVAVAAVGFAVAGAMWWIYFDVGARDSADELQDAEEDSAPEKEAVDERHDLFVYGHLPTAFGVVLAGVGIEELVLHPSTPLPSAYGWLLATGLGLFLGWGGDDPGRHPAQLACGVALAPGGGPAGARHRPGADHRPADHRRLRGLADRAGDRRDPAESPLSEWHVRASHSAQGR